MGPPLLGTSAICAVLFHANGAALQATAGIEDPRNTDAVPLHLVAVAGAAAGAAQVAVCSPLELVMIRLQTQHVFSPGRSLYAGPIDCALKIVQAGGARALYQGLPATLLRDPPNYFSYFLGYEVAKRAQTPVGGSSKDLSALQLLAAGGVAGIAAQLTQLPMDVVKTRMQSQPDANPLYRSTWDCYKVILLLDWAVSVRLTIPISIPVALQRKHTLKVDWLHSTRALGQCSHAPFQQTR